MSLNLPVWGSLFKQLKHISQLESWMLIDRCKWFLSTINHYGWNNPCSLHYTFYLRPIISIWFCKNTFSPMRGSPFSLLFWRCFHTRNQVWRGLCVHVNWNAAALLGRVWWVVALPCAVLKRGWRWGNGSKIGPKCKEHGTSFPPKYTKYAP